ncbi:hypothetical protein [Streptacidiphilus sp. P02-A3a]|uniref:hypothetical protein n=1 Tax=Streptacidiphilus sp. P02-A3a TaxID=2704468 RepID=UPI0015FC3310|nr:hypothetical protein [Streptacidiphilus sp. P02-A3a]QMU71682.1 DUF1275 domain-containing protein [Streptacidiphilus sp. P02-A3a]
MPEKLEDRPVLGEHASLVLYTAASGAVDTLAFTALGHVFAGVMTGILLPGRADVTGVTGVKCPEPVTHQ